jgi:hypothetical protein
LLECYEKADLQRVVVGRLEAQMCLVFCVLGTCLAESLVQVFCRTLNRYQLRYFAPSEWRRLARAATLLHTFSLPNQGLIVLCSGLKAGQETLNPTLGTCETDPFADAADTLAGG